jgi:hypothetical protein
VIPIVYAFTKLPESSLPGHWCHWHSLLLFTEDDLCSPLMVAGDIACMEPKGRLLESCGAKEILPQCPDP